MEQIIFQNKDQKIAEIVSDQIEIRSVQDALDWMANASYEGAQNLVVYEHNLSPEFFDLKTQLAGDILQKAANYHMKVAIVGDFAQYESKSLRAFMVECNRGRQIFFVTDRETAVARLTA
jgi:hypothetical protein